MSRGLVRPELAPQYYSPEEAAVVLGVSRDQIYKWLRSGALMGFTIGRLKRIPVRSLAPEMLALSPAKQRKVHV